MKRPDTIMIEGRAYSWRASSRRAATQLEAWKAAQPRQPALFELRDDRGPAGGAHAQPGATLSRP